MIFYLRKNVSINVFSFRGVNVRKAGAGARAGAAGGRQAPGEGEDML